MDATAIRALVLATLGLAIVLLARRPARRLFGAGPAFTLWGLPALLALLPWLPLPAHAISILPALRVLPALTVDAPARAGPTGTVLARLVGFAWLAGAACAIGRLAFHYLRLQRATRPVPPELRQGLTAELPATILHRLRLHPDGPAVLWAPRALLLLPADLLERFDPPERQLVLRHELTHLRRHDPLWSLLAELAGALLWFHPLTWLALPRFRLDQELACDERVLRDAPQDEARYARTLLRSTGIDSRPALLPWLVVPQLKERLVMIRRRRPQTARRGAGFVALAVLMVAATALAQGAATTAQASVPANVDLSYLDRNPPRYPPAAIKNKEQGTIVLDILVHADGSVGNIQYDARRSTTRSAVLIAAATAAAQRWRFNPQMKNGRPVAGYARVPVRFSLTDNLAATPSKG